METQVRTPQAIFSQPQRFLVPLFQRPYVWNEEQQWEPLWRDVERVAKRLLSDPAGKHAPHFLGAVVLQQVPNNVGELQSRVIIDGQQRLTTLQILIDALDAELRRAGAIVQADRLEYLIENDKRFRKHDHDRFKVWPTNRDQPAFTEVMTAASPVDYAQLTYKSERLVRAHRYFSEQSREWLICEDDTARMNRADAIERSVRELLQIVVIDLAADENAQEIFETLNARGAQLTAADLIKNFVFQKLVDAKADVEKAYETYWKEFETAFWEEEVNAGRLRHQRSSLFINHWLISRTGKEVVSREVFSRFKWYADHDAGVPIDELLRQLSHAAKTYRAITEATENSSGPIDAVGLFSFRIGALESDVMRSVLLALLDEHRERIAPSVVESALATIETWLVRRMLVRGSTKNYNQLVPELVSVIRQTDAGRVDQAVKSFLLSQTSEHRYWPDDQEVTRELARMPIYRRISRGRLRMVLEAIEDHLRGYCPGGKEFAGSRVVRGAFHIEHLMPRSWEQKWPAPVGGTVEERAQRLHTLGNLTLLTKRLNSSVSNGPWGGETGKKEALRKNDVLLLNRMLGSFEGGGWSDDSIERRTEALTRQILTIWPAPPGYKSSTARDATPETHTIDVADLLSGGLLAAGQQLRPVSSAFKSRTAVVLPDGRIDVDGQVFDTPSGAGRAVRGRSTNGWTFWLVDLTTKKSLAALRREYLEQSAFATDALDGDEDDAGLEKEG